MINPVRKSHSNQSLTQKAPEIMRRLIIITGIALIILIALGAIACYGSKQVTVSIDSPYFVDAGSEFGVKLNIKKVKGLASYQVDVTYDPTVIQVVGEESGKQGVTRGYIGNVTIPVAAWGFAPIGEQGRARVRGNVTGVGGAGGSGYLAEIHFRVVSSAGTESRIKLSNGNLVDVSNPKQNMAITTIKWQSVTIEVVGNLPSPSPFPSPSPSPSPSTSPYPCLPVCPPPCLPLCLPPCPPVYTPTSPLPTPTINSL